MGSTTPYKNVTVKVTYKEGMGIVLDGVKEVNFLGNGLVECVGKENGWWYFINVSEVKSLHFAPSDYRGIYEVSGNIMGFTNSQQPKETEGSEK